VPRSNWMRRESTGAHFTLKLANSGMTSVGRARFKSPLAHSVSACQTPIHRPGREDDGRDFRRLDGQAGRLGRQPLQWIEQLLDT
jgi:hypothetical protein